MKKFIKRIIIGNFVFNLIISLATLFVILNALDKAEIIDLDELGIIDKFQSSSSSRNSASVDAILESCEKIAKFYAEKGYTYDQESGLWNIKYQEQLHRGSCCTIYVQQVLYDVGLLQIDNWESIWMSADFGNWLTANVDWDRFVAKSENDLKPGDINIYTSNGKSHTNIFAGMGKTMGMRRILGCRTKRCRSSYWKNQNSRRTIRQRVYLLISFK